VKRGNNVNLAVGSYLAAIDMGSNSFHLLIAQLKVDGWQAIYTEERRVQLAAGSDTGHLQPDAQQRALQCLREYKKIMAGYCITELHVAATASLRNVSNAEPFLSAVEGELGVRPIIISGEREAELVFRGVTAGLVSPGDGQYLVVDIGGGSTELAWGSAAQMHGGVSVDVGCLRYLRYFPRGELQRQYFVAARDAAAKSFQQALTNIPTSFAASPPQVIACSGTVLAVWQVLMAQPEYPQSAGIRLLELRALAADLLAFNSVEEVHYPGLAEDQRSIFASGVAVVLALFEVLNIDAMQLSQRGLREGIIENRLTQSALKPQQGQQQQ
jgi:exopolyphosphatase/guanosine-5'-triphosphate,3'-diphosphate pyrophosphatase